MIKIFDTVEEVEKYYCHSVYMNDKEQIVVGSRFSNNKLEIILLDAVSEIEHIKTAEECFKEVTYMGKPFGKEV